MSFSRSAIKMGSLVIVVFSFLALGIFLLRDGILHWRLS
jgi:hypothetical protein